MSEGLQFYGAIGAMLDGNRYLQSKFCILRVASRSQMSVSLSWTDFLSAINIMRKKIMLINEVSI